ncbi:MAG: rhodanese-like domain-containing protein [Pelagimonas sp.]|nr:rhodanese-like domain-containing protein [Pelagimonas sp.]
MTLKTILITASLIPAMVAPLAAQDLAEEVIGHMDFIPYEDGIILPQQISKDLWDGAYFVDTRTAAQFAQGTIPGAVNIEWREIPSRLDELPSDKKVILFCNTGSLSAQASFAARLLGRENVVVLQSGLLGWRETAAYIPEQ